jgi:hypothetical protein
MGQGVGMTEVAMTVKVRSEAYVRLLHWANLDGVDPGDVATVILEDYLMGNNGGWR